MAADPIIIKSFFRKAAQIVLRSRTQDDDDLVSDDQVDLLWESFNLFGDDELQWELALSPWTTPYLPNSPLIIEVTVDPQYLAEVGPPDSPPCLIERWRIDFDRRAVATPFQKNTFFKNCCILARTLLSLTKLLPAHRLMQRRIPLQTSVLSQESSASFGRDSTRLHHLGPLVSGNGSINMVCTSLVPNGGFFVVRHRFSLGQCVREDFIAAPPVDFQHPRIQHPVAQLIAPRPTEPISIPNSRQAWEPPTYLGSRPRFVSPSSGDSLLQVFQKEGTSSTPESFIALCQESRELSSFSGKSSMYRSHTLASIDDELRGFLELRNSLEKPRSSV